MVRTGAQIARRRSSRGCRRRSLRGAPVPATDERPASAEGSTALPALRWPTMSNDDVTSGPDGTPQSTGDKRTTHQCPEGLMKNNRHSPSSEIVVGPLSRTVVNPAEASVGVALAVAVAVDVIDWEKLGHEARETLRHARAASTLKAYGEDWRHFVAWTADVARPHLPADPHDVASYLSHLGSLQQPKSVSKIQRSAAAIAYAHRIAGALYNARHPVLLEMMDALRRKLGTAPMNQMRPLLAPELAAVCSPLGAALLDVRDRALLVLGFLSGCRPSNLVAVTCADLVFTPAGLDVTLRRSKTDQVGEGFLVSIPTQADAALCAVETVRAWTAAAEITDGVLFRAVDRHGRVGGPLTVQEVRRMLRRRAERVGLTLEGSTEFGSHSLRSGFCTSAAAAGRTVEQIMRQTGHRRPDTVFRYIRHADRYRDNAAEGLLGDPGSARLSRAWAGRTGSPPRR
jgi:integrase